MAADATATTRGISGAALERLDECIAAFAATRIPPTQDGMFAVRVERERLRDLVQRLRDDAALGFDLILDVTALDHCGREPRFEVVVHLYSMTLQSRIRIKTTCTERDPHVPSLVPLFIGANFHERETFDMFGIVFDGHPDLRRILMPHEFEHHPLRKDYPLEGIEPEKVYRQKGGAMMPRPPGAEPIDGAGSSTP